MNDIKQCALELGFDLVGITSAAPPPHGAMLRHWLNNHYHGEMGYMARRVDERLNLNRILPGVRSVIVVGMNYFTGPENSDQPGRVARYAQGPCDYHDVIGEKLARLAGIIRTNGHSSKWYVDTGPILERDLAQRAGIGFIGKHTNLISRSFGNWILLGVLLTTQELPADPAHGTFCGTCRRCLDVCPTRAIIAPYRLDARLCISYLTIELKGSIPAKLRPLIGDHLFGCDDCLEVCPWNRFARQSPIAGFRRHVLPSLTEFLAWNDATFRSFFAGTPVARLKRRGFLRNVCVVLGNTGDASALPALQRACGDADSLVREHAAWAVEQIGTDQPAKPS